MPTRNSNFPDGRMHASNWWSFDSEKKSVDKLKNPTYKDLKQKHKALNFLKSANEFTTTASAEELEKIVLAVKTVKENVDFKIGYKAWILKSIVRLVSSEYRQIDRLYNQIMKNVNLSEVILYRSFPPEFQNKPNASANEIHEFFQRTDVKEYMRNAQNLTIELNPETSFSLDCLERFENLQSLTVIGGQEVVIPESISKLKELKHLELTNISCVKLPMNTSGLQNLKSLNLSYSQLDPNSWNSIASLNQLEHLNMDHCFSSFTFSEVNFPITLPSTLKSLTVDALSCFTTKALFSVSSGKQHPLNPIIKELPKNLEELRISEHVILQQNSIPDDSFTLFNDCPNLKIFDCQMPLIRTTPHIQKKMMTMLANSPNLEEVRVDCWSELSDQENKNLSKNMRIFTVNQLRGAVMPTFREFKNLENLEIQNYGSTQPETNLKDYHAHEKQMANMLCDELKNLPGTHMQSLNVNLGKSDSFPENIFNWKGLKNLSLEINENISMQEKFPPLPHLENLSMVNFNAPKTMNFSGCPNLKNLKLTSKKQIEKLEGADKTENVTILSEDVNTLVNLLDLLPETLKTLELGIYQRPNSDLILTPEHEIFEKIAKFKNLEQLTFTGMKTEDFPPLLKNLKKLNKTQICTA